MPKNGTPSDERERRRLARLDRDAVKDHLRRGGDEVDDQIALADRAAAGKDDHVGAGAARPARVRAPRACRATGGCGSATPPCARDDGARA